MVWSLFYHILKWLHLLASYNIFFPFFLIFEVISNLDAKVCFLDASEEGKFFYPICYPVFSLLENWHHWCWELSASSVCLLPLFCCGDMIFFSCSETISFLHFFLVLLAFSAWSFSSGTFYTPVFVGKYCLNLVFIIEFFLSPFKLAVHLWSLSL